MPRYKIITLVDITITNAKKTDSDPKKIKQQSNFNSLRQAIELRSNVEWNKDPVKQDGRLPDDIEGKATYWTWDFEVEREDIFLDHDDPVFLLRDDLNGVPIISNLDNSCIIDPPIIKTKGKDINTWVRII